MSLADHLGYLKARLRDYEARPDLHAASIAAYRKLISIAESRPQDYEREAGDMFEVARAKQVDRALSLAGVFAGLDEPDAAAAQRHASLLFEKTTGYTDLVTRGGSIKKSADPIMDLIKEKRNALYEFLGLLLTAHLASQKERTGFARAVQQKWAVLKGLDPSISWEKIKNAAPYRSMIYYSDAQLSMLARWHAEMEGV